MAIERDPEIKSDPPVVVGVTKHTELTDKEVDGIIDHANHSIPRDKFLEKPDSYFAEATVPYGVTTYLYIDRPAGIASLVHLGLAVIPGFSITNKVGVHDEVQGVAHVTAERTGDYGGNIISTPFPISIGEGSNLRGYFEVYNGDTVDRTAVYSVFGVRIKASYGIVDSITVGYMTSTTLEFSAPANRMVRCILARIECGGTGAIYSSTSIHLYDPVTGRTLRLDGENYLANPFSNEKRDFYFSDTVELHLYVYSNEGDTPAKFICLGEVV